MTRYTDFVNYNLSMLQDQVRTESYRRAIKQTVRPGDVVLDLGTGSGALACFACQAGARRVYAIEAEDVIEMAKQICRKNGYQDRVAFVKDHSFRADLPERVDVLVTETMGTFGLDEGLLGSVIDARDRFLKPNGVIIPRSLELFTVPVELPGFYQHMVDFWASNRFGVDFSPVRRYAVNNFHPIRLHEDAFLSDPAATVRTMLSDATTSTVGNTLSFDAKRRGQLHGIAGWFTAELIPGLSLSNAPSSASSHWGMAFFPVEHQVPVERGNRMRIDMRSQSNGSLWTWDVEVHGQRCQHSTIWGFQQASGEAHKLSPTFAPRLSARGHAEFFLLSLLNGHKTVHELQEELLERYPDLIMNIEQAAAFVQDIVIRLT
jgi:protein arginine N-methyltransferase 1